jgi:hypothetical protein
MFSENDSLRPTSDEVTSEPSEQVSTAGSGQEQGS